MTHIVVWGAGPVGLATAMLVAAAGHRVTVLEKDTAGVPGNTTAAWEHWRRPGVSQLRQPHIMLPRGWQVLSRELPLVLEELSTLGGRPHNMAAGAWTAAPAVGGRLPGDERFTTVAARRPVYEAAFAAAAARTDGVTVRRGVTVTGLLAGGRARTPGRPHIVGVRTGDGEEIRGDLVVDAGGRRAPAVDMLTALGAPRPLVERQSTGFRYYSRYFTSADGRMPEQAAWPLEHHDSLSSIMVPGDSGTWSLAPCVSGRDRAMRALRDEAAWHRAVALYPGIAHWATGTPVTGVMPMSAVESVYRRFVVDGRPVATGLLSVGDAWASANQVFGLGLSMGLAHATLLRDALGGVGPDDAEKLALRFDSDTEAELTPLYREVDDWSGHRQAQIAGEVAGVPYETDDPAWHFRQALDAAALRDPEVFRAVADIASVLAPANEVLAAPGLVGKVMALGGQASRYPADGPSRARLLTALQG